LKGEEIPIAARIFAIADVWDNLSSDTYNRKAMSRLEALDYIRGQSGKHFDPGVVDAFLDLFDEPGK
jgi:response regulator RpfG family c-di-GMP phosphodiesterase